MAEMEKRSGGCLCGAVRFTATPAKREMAVCHCGMCRKWTGGVLMAVACRDLAFDEEAPLGVFRSSDHGERLFCATCGSTLVWRTHDGGSVEVALAAFDDQSGFVFADEIFIDDKPALYAFANATRKLTGAEAVAEFAALQEPRADG